MQNFSAKGKGSLDHRSYAFSLAVIRLTDTLPNKRAAWVIGDQLLRSAMSIGANQVEGKASSSRLEFKKFLEISLKSANETKYWLSLLRDSGIGTAGVIEPLQQEVTELANMLAKSVLTLKGK